MPLIPTLGRQRQAGLHGFKARLVFIAVSGQPELHKEILSQRERERERETDRQRTKIFGLARGEQKDDSVVERPGCACRGPEFCFQHSQPF